jgi:hypothetical protein
MGARAHMERRAATFASAGKQAGKKTPPHSLANATISDPQQLGPACEDITAVSDARVR